MGIFGVGGERGQKSAEYSSQAQAEDKSPVMSYGETEPEDVWRLLPGFSPEMHCRFLTEVSAAVTGRRGASAFTFPALVLQRALCMRS